MPEFDSPIFEPREKSFSSMVARLRLAAWAFTTRRVPRGAPYKIVTDVDRPAAGDVVLARVDVIGHHGRLQLPSGRRKTLFIGDEIVVIYGNRYAPNQFEAIVPQTLGPCQLVTGSGVAGKALSWHRSIGKGPTQITPLGLLAGASGAPINLRDHALRPVQRLPARCPTALAVVGTAMDSGKTHTAAFLVKGLTRAGVRVGYAKLTGTGAGADTFLLQDAGAVPVLDFSDAGLVSTYRVGPAEMERVVITLIGHLRKAGVDAMVFEVADGVLQAETAALLTSVVFQNIVSGILFAACDSLGAVAGVDWLRGHGLPVVGLSGVMTAAPLLQEEAAQATGLPIFSRSELARPSTAMKILHWAEEQARRRGVETPVRPVAPADEAAALGLVQNA